MSRTAPAFVVAHQAGNDLDLLRRALAAGAAAVEVDVYLHRGVVEVRHDRRVPGLPLLWRRWVRFTRAAGAFHTLADVLDATPRDVLVLVDVKGGGDAGRAIAEILEADGPRRVAICGRTWRHLAPFVDHDDVQAVFSVGNRRELRRLWARRGVDGVSIRHTMLDAGLLAQLATGLGPVWCWTVNSPARADQLDRWGAAAIITDHPHRLLAED